MDALTWTGALGGFLDLPFQIVALLFLGCVTLYFVASFAFVDPAVKLASGPFASDGARVNGGGSSAVELMVPAVGLALLFWAIDSAVSDPALAGRLGGGAGGLLGAMAFYLIAALVAAYLIQRLAAPVYDGLMRYALVLLLVLVLANLILGALMPTGSAGIIGAISKRLLPVWIALIVTFVLSIRYKNRLGLYGKLFNSPVGMVGLALVLFWVFVAIFGGPLDLIVTHDELTQVSGMKNKVPGTPLRGAEEGDYAWYLLGGDNLARDVFSRAVKGSWIVVLIAPAATLFAFMVGITLGLPAGYYGGKLDTVLSFLSNLILAFPVILLFFLLVTPEIVATGLPNYMATILFVFPVVFFAVLLNSRYYTQPELRNILIFAVLVPLFWLYLALVSEPGTKVVLLPSFLDPVKMPPEILVVFVSVVFVNSPTVFRIVRGLTLDVKTRDYVAAAQTRGEGAWYIMLWEILPNVRGPLIVDFCLRIGYATILLGTLGFFGLGLESESPDWGSTINAGRRLLSVYLAPALVPALSLMSLVLGLNLLADGLREESLKD